MKPLLILLLFLSSLTSVVRADEPQLITHERKSPVGIPIESWTYYLGGNNEHVKHGLSKIYYGDGRVLNQTEYQHGKRSGTTTTFYKGIEKKDYEAQYQNDCTHGMVRQWAPDGKLLFECEYRNGRPWQGRASNNSRSSIGDVEETTTIPTVEYRQGAIVAGSNKTFEVSWQHQREEDLPNMAHFSRWSWPPYKITSDYPFLYKMPDYKQVPFLIQWCAADRDSSSIAYSQLVALTRVDVGAMRSSDPQKNTKTAQKWNDWWESVGQHQLKPEAGIGARDLAAWKLVARDRDLAAPAKPIVLPTEYSIKLTFRSGDYQGVVRETIVLQRDKQSASLERTFSLKTHGRVLKQQWKPFTTEDADRTARAIGYLIDHPWLLNDEKAINERFWQERKERKEKQAAVQALSETEKERVDRLVIDYRDNLRSSFSKRVKGRESFGMYYPGATFELKDGNGNLWWNDDPTNWHGIREERYRRPDQPMRSTVYPFFASLFPESQLRDEENETGWEKFSQ